MSPYLEAGLALVAVPVLLFAYAYVGYPLILRLLGPFRPAPRRWGDPPEWPTITITVPVYNEERSIRGLIESLLALDYPADRRQILIVSDASTDGTDGIVREYADRGVELLRVPLRGGKTAAENAAHPHLRGSIVVNTDATIRILPASLKPLIRSFQDPTVGVASGRDVSVGDVTREANLGESGYVGYEMWVRSLETRLGSIVGASGCFYAIRRELHETLFPAALSRDFAAALIARERGYRAVSVDEAICLVPRTVSLAAEYRRKVRTMARGLETLFYKARLMNPFRYGGFALMLISHKLCRWLVPLTVPGALVGLLLLSAESRLAAAALAAVAAGALLAMLGILWPRGRPPRPLAVLAFALVANLAGIQAWLKALRGERNPIWEPTRRPA
ncbi:MAG TPA: glycosyltransferase family 2 protein [Gemmatimonadales bacterium]|nr:glycosyltransferase family 2 protein [Gemmatimonadales bacterium]